MPKPKTTKLIKKKATVAVAEVRVSIYSSFNNTIITAASYHSGQVLDWSSSGRAGFKGTKKGTPYAATQATKDLLTRLATYQPTTLYVSVSGAGNGRDASLRALAAAGLKIAFIQDTTALPHNGCRPKKARRV